VTVLDRDALARELVGAYATGTTLPAPPSVRDTSFDMAAAYAVEAECVRLRQASGRTPVGRKVGFANRAMWRVLKLPTLVWAHMYDDTVQYAATSDPLLSLAGRCAPRLEPEIVFTLKHPLESGSADVIEVLKAVDWLALGVEINDCVFPGWQFTPVDFVAALGFHTALVVGARRLITPEDIPVLADALPRFTVTLFRDGQFVEEGSGRNALRSPALCLGELAGAIARQPGAEPLAAGEIISTGTLTTPQPVAAGETWRADTVGLDLPPLTLRFS
jgi:2-keto-4-pentenoate hydratase